MLHAMRMVRIWRVFQIHKFCHGKDHIFLKRNSKPEEKPQLLVVESQPKRLLKIIVVSEKCSRETYLLSPSDVFQ